MANRKTTKSKARGTKRKRSGQDRPRRSAKSKRRTKRSRPGISDARLERALRVLNETKDIATAARSIRVSPERFKRAAKGRQTIRKQKGFWIVIRGLPRRMPVFSGSRQLAVTVTSKSASLIARYMSAVRQFLRTNDPKLLAEFAGRGVKDARGKVHPFETDPNVLYRLSAAGNEPFEEIYRIVI